MPKKSVTSHDAISNNLHTIRITYDCVEVVTELLMYVIKKDGWRDILTSEVFISHTTAVCGTEVCVHMCVCPYLSSLGPILTMYVRSTDWYTECDISLGNSLVGAPWSSACNACVLCESSVAMPTS